MRTSGRGQGWPAQPCAGRVPALVTPLLCWLVVVMGVAGCPSLPPLPPPAPPAVLERVPPAEQGPSAEYPLGPGDVLRITIYGHGDLPQEVVLAADGSFTYPFIGSVQAAGLTVPQLTAAMARRLEEGYLVAPQITITVTQYSSQQVYVLGAVKAPGVQTLKRNTTLLELIAAAGGPTPEAGAEVIIARAKPPEETRRPGQSQRNTEAVRVNLEKLLAGEVAQRLEIERGDTVYIPKGEFFFISGEVQKPGRYPLERDTTVAKALILAGGPSKFAAPKRATVQRVVEGQRLEYHADMNDILQADDILVVPQSIF
jgi:polysaccharide export outer membrane protein